MNDTGAGKTGGKAGGKGDSVGGKPKPKGQGDNRFGVGNGPGGGWGGPDPAGDRTRVTPRGGGREPEPKTFSVDAEAAGIPNAQADSRTSGLARDQVGGPTLDMRTPSKPKGATQGGEGNGPHRGGGEGRPRDGSRYGVLDDRERHGPDAVEPRAPGSRGAKGAGVEEE